MEFKGTKGKWEIETKGIFVTCGTAKIANCSSYNELCGGDYLPRDEEKANALLISKAPEMLKLLMACHEEFINYRSAFGQGSSLEELTKQLIKEATEI